MGLSLKCVCGAILEIDASFQGKVVACPDCNRKLDTSPPPPPPAMTSAWAYVGFLASTVGMLTLVGPAIGVACSAIALAKMRTNKALGGRRLAWAGLSAGGLFLVVGVWAFFGGEFLGVDGMLRVFLARDLTPGERVVRAVRVNDETPRLTLLLPRGGAGWGQHLDDDLALSHPWHDAHVVAFPLALEKGDDAKSVAIQRFVEVRLIKRLAKGAEIKFPEPAQVKPPEGEDESRFRAEFTIGATPRVFWFRILHDTVVAAGARLSRFPRLEAELREILDGATMEKQP